MNLLPRPKQMSFTNGSFKLNHDTIIALDKECNYHDFEAAQLLREDIKQISGLDLRITITLQDPCNSIKLQKVKGNKQEYQLEISSFGIKISSNDNTGLFYGVQTLRQIIREKGTELPYINILDWPFFPNRGFYHDVTRGKVPKLKTLMELVDRISFYKINQLQLYIEHTFAFKNHSEVWAGEDPITAEEILILDEYCKRKHVELVPSLSTFGHLYHALTSRTFKDLNELEIEPGQPFSWVTRQRHYTLNTSNPNSFAFVKSMIDEFLPLFTSDKFNICSDETFDLGEGKDKEFGLNVGKDRLYMDFLKKVICHVQSYHKQVMFWGDMLLKYPHLLSEVPENVVCLNWDYNPDTNGEGIKKLFESGIKQYVCPGVHAWNRLICNRDCADENIARVIEYGRHYSAIGVLITDWGDFGHINFLSNSIPAMIHGASLSWNPDIDENSDKLDETISILEFGDNSGKLVGLLRNLSKQPIMEWEHLVLWYYKEKCCYDISGYEYETVYKPVLLKSSETDIINRYYTITQIGDEIQKIYPLVYQQVNQDIQEYLISTRMLGLLQVLLLVIKKYSFGQFIKNTIYSPRQLAEYLEYWLVDFSNAWRKGNKESDLFRIKDLIMDLCGILRDFQEKES